LKIDNNDLLYTNCYFNAVSIVVDIGAGSPVCSPQCPDTIVDVIGQGHDVFTLCLSDTAARNSRPIGRVASKTAVSGSL
jgi:hypothetical protein